MGCGRLGHTRASQGSFEGYEAVNKAMKNLTGLITQCYRRGYLPRIINYIYDNSDMYMLLTGHVWNAVRDTRRLIKL